MSTTVTTTALGTSNLRGSSSKTRNLPARTSRNPRTSLRQNSLLSIPTSAPGAQQPEPEPHGFYPAITHFTDAITALPRDFRRHTSLLKEVDAKAWALEENLQKLLQHCLHERQTRHSTSTAQTVAGSVSSVAGDVPTASAPGSFVGNVLDTASQYSIDSGDADTMRRRRLYAELRNNLMQMIMPLDEKNHVINNANEELSRHIRRQDEIWPHIADEISEETRLGSLRHWALVDLNPTKKTLAAAARGREAALLDNNEVAERSERRREAMALAKKQKTALQQDSDVEARKATRKGGPGAKKVQETEDALTGANNLVAAAAAMTKTASSRGGANKALKEAIKNAAARGGVSMSRENSQQETTKKRKAATAAAAPARKRLNATTQESPKLAHSPLAATFSKEVHKKSPALSHAKPANGRSRQVSTQVGEASNRPSSSASRRNGVTVAGTEFDRATATTGKTKSEVKNTMKETTNARGEKMLEENVPDSVDNRIKGGILLERSGSKQGQLRREAAAESTGRRTVSPRLNTAALAESNKNGKSRAPRSTPQLGTFIDDTGAGDSSQDAPTSAGTENGNDPNKLKRPARPRMKDHHGLHDSLSPKGLPTKRHKKNASYSLAAALTSRASRDEGDERPIPTSMDRKGANSRTGSRSTKQDSRDGGARHASSTPKIGGPDRELVDEPEEMPDTKPTTLRKASSRRTSHARQHSLDVKPPSTNATHKALHNATSASAQMSPILKAETPLGSPGPAEDQDQDDQDLDETLEDHEIPDAPALPNNISQGPSAEDEEEEEDDPNEARYCYCNGVSYGEMVACDNEDCVREWFHLECTGLRALPPARSTWYCDDCKGNMAR